MLSLKRFVNVVVMAMSVVIEASYYLSQPLRLELPQYFLKKYHS